MAIPILEPTETHLRHCGDFLNQGKLVAIPTETVYGLAGNALSPKSIAKIFSVKSRPFFDPLIVHIASRKDIVPLVKTIPPYAKILMKQFWPGPLTLVLPKSALIPDLITSGLPNVAIRMPKHILARKLIRQCGFPLAAPSCNKFTRLSPTAPHHIQKQFRSGIEAILDGGPCKVGVESTVIAVEKTHCRILRHGGIAQEDIEQYVPLKKRGHRKQIEAPGQVKHHYAPRTPVIPWSRQWGTGLFPDSGFIGFRSLPRNCSFKAFRLLSPSGNLEEAAANLFQYLYELDRKKLKRIYVMLPPNRGIGKAIRDRLTRSMQSSD